MLTKNDLNLISKLVRTEIRTEIQASEKRMSKMIDDKLAIQTEEIYNRVDTMIDEKLSNQIGQTFEFINTLHKSHEDWLRDHDLRIKKLEDNTLSV
ncbi:hypothetical protein A3A93_06205 [Candidatus Roizmanbacteria bacterium RIFCSPLOWO2_01_FULL_38_12]|uniref:Uncharacterized protein n=1 Tax=Candidatus Roizmanbacteria bacterium RIFCSPLOWO2_01_FULL_38_12 TaxID=1802061 RepID=A0A1F7ITX8_9BACT|nr:MAG: hypothetical protein A3F59_00520 [Candidatus Roizmanbacteria bacterium RIFCSPHIGHO2_12_FULL_38_13]OGK46822.1 MAG: hypothetical protein A3A93_06205 [Candidatus Roizmanbacteria bacterium RIFCSPLOWO2_01_FULL_38_12]